VCVSLECERRKEGVGEEEASTTARGRTKRGGEARSHPIPFSELRVLAGSAASTLTYHYVHKASSPI